jgi:pimeloyl-ACP methyl ester carboxylesterase
MSGTPASGFAEINGARLFYEVAGDGPPLVLIHAGIADSRMWEPQMDAFAGEFRVLRYDMRGFGRSDMPPVPFAHHDDLRELLRVLDIPRAILIGASYGGNVATACALEHPEAVAALVLVNSRVANETPTPELRDAWAAVDALWESGDVAGANELELRMWVDGPLREPGEVDPAVRALVGEMNGALLARAGEAEEAEERELDPPAHARLAEIGVPTLAIVGELDQPDVLAGNDRLVGNVPHARRVDIAKAAHLPSMEHPAEVNRAVLEFVRGLPV